MRVFLTSRVLRLALLASILPTLLLTPLQADIILLHSHCVGGTHAHRLDAADLSDWRVYHPREASCCDSGEGGGHDVTTGAPARDCDHNEPAIMIAMGPFLATRASQVSAAHVTKTVHSAVIGVPPGQLVIAEGRNHYLLDTPGPMHAPGNGTAEVLARNHALLF